MTVTSWLEHAVAHADTRGISGLKPFLEALARSTELLRKADEELRTLETNGRSDERADA